jgi:hypothetical protein
MNDDLAAWAAQQWRENSMRIVTLYKDDLARDSVMSWDGLLENLGVETHTIVAGRTIDKEIESVEISVGHVVARNDSGELVDD